MHTGASVRMHGCAECDHYFIDVSTFYNHMRRRHGNWNFFLNYYFHSELQIKCIFHILGLDSVMAKEKAVIIEPNGSK